MHARACVLLGAALFLTACEERMPALIVHISSSLEIGLETNSLFVRVLETDNTSTERTYALGSPPRDAWPQVLPIIARDGSGEMITIAAELRNSRPGSPSVAVGYGEMQAALPSGGEDDIELVVPRACEDLDGDGYGRGFGCLLPDCDDTREDVPSPNFCPGPPQPDSGVTDVGPIEDTGPHDDAGPNDDAGPDDDATAAEGDAGDAGPPECTPACANDQVCFGGYCRDTCSGLFDCEDIAYGCLSELGVCICRVPCQNGTECGPFACTDGCCHL